MYTILCIIFSYLSELDDDDEPERFSLFWSESDESSSDAFCNLNFKLKIDDNTRQLFTHWFIDVHNNLYNLTTYNCFL